MPLVGNTTQNITLAVFPQRRLVSVTVYQLFLFAFLVALPSLEDISRLPAKYIGKKPQEQGDVEHKSNI